MKINPSIFKAYDIRGVYPHDLNEKNIVPITAAIYTFFSKKLKKKNPAIVIGRDMRTSTPALFDAVTRTLRSFGANVIDIGLTSTPTFYFGALQYGYDAGIMITASHNPKEYNGLKFVIRADDRLLKIGADSGMFEVRDLAQVGKFEKPEGDGKLSKNTTVQADEIDHALSKITIDKNCDLMIVTDTANGMAITYINELFNRFPKINIIRMNEKLDGSFPAHEANPLKFETLVDLQKRVVSEKADFGIAPDADGDRIFFIDEKGSIVPATMITCLVADELLRKNSGAMIVVDIRYIKNVQNLVKKKGGKTSITKVGHAFISAHMANVDAVFAGESSGHFFFKSTGYAESSALVLAHFLARVCREKKPLSEILSDYHTAFESGEFNFTVPAASSAQEILAGIKDTYKDASYSPLDGLSGDFGSSRFNIRTSNTEPLMRLNVEADTKLEMEEKVKILTSHIESFGATKA